MIELKHKKTGDLIASLDLPTLARADLSGACFTGGSLIDLILKRADLNGADFTDAIMGGCCFIDCKNLHLAVGLDTIRHQRPRGLFRHPSSLDMATVRRSMAALPTTFLLGMEFSHDEIQALKKLFPGEADD